MALTDKLREYEIDEHIRSIDRQYDTQGSNRSVEGVRKYLVAPVMACGLAMGSIYGCSSNPTNYAEDYSIGDVPGQVENQQQSVAMVGEAAARAMKNDTFSMYDIEGLNNEYRRMDRTAFAVNAFWDGVKAWLIYRGIENYRDDSSDTTPSQDPSYGPGGSDRGGGGTLR